MFRSNWTILKDLMLSLAKAATAVAHYAAHTTHTSQPEILVATTPHII